MTIGPIVDKSGMARMPLNEEVNAVMQPYIFAIGRLTFTWNYLHEQLGNLLSPISGMKSEMSSAMWYALRTDAAQRDILRAAVVAARSAAAPRIALLDEIDWILKQTNELINDRNTAVHTMMSVAIDSNGLRLIPTNYNGNPRAAAIGNTDVTARFRWTEDRATVLAGHAREICRLLRMTEPGQFKRPKIPTLQEFQKKSQTPRGGGFKPK